MNRMSYSEFYLDENGGYMPGPYDEKNLTYGADIGGGYLNSKGYTIRSHFHNQFDTPIPGYWDMIFAGEVNDNFKDATLYIYFNGEDYQFDRGGMVQVPQSVTLEEVEIAIPRKP